MILAPHRTIWITFFNSEIVDPPLVRQITDRGFRNLGGYRSGDGGGIGERERQEFGNLGRL